MQPLPGSSARLKLPPTLLQASDSVKHMCLPCHWTQRGSIVADFVRSYGSAGRTIVFCDTKKDVNELVTSLADTCGAQALHGDIPQVLARLPESQTALGQQAHMWHNLGVDHSAWARKKLLTPLADSSLLVCEG